jgi:hypothetical protein
MHHLSVYLSQEWLTDDHELLMLKVLEEDLHEVGRDDCIIENTTFSLLLGNAFNKHDNYTLDRNFVWLRRKGRELAAGQKQYLATIININDVHWAALVINFEEHEILFGDSYQNPIPSRLRSIVNWWTLYHTGQQFTHSSLAIARQRDSFSCGMLAWNALQHYLLPSTTLMDGCHPSIDHAKMFLRLTKDYRNQVRTTSRVT